MGDKGIPGNELGQSKEAIKFRQEIGLQELELRHKKLQLRKLVLMDDMKKIDADIIAQKRSLERATIQYKEFLKQNNMIEEVPSV